MATINDFSSVSRKYLAEAVKARVSAAAMLQTAIGGAVYQLSMGNTDWLTDLVEGLSHKSGDKLVVGSDGKQMNAYFRFLELPVSWDKETQRYKVAGKRKFSEMDWDKAAHQLANGQRWDMFNKQSADNAFDFDKALVAVLRKGMDKEGLSNQEIESRFRRAMSEAAA